MSADSLPRRELLKASAGLASLGAVGVLAGCSGGGGGGGSGGSGSGDGPLSPGPDAVPAEATSMVVMDFEQIRTDEGLQRIVSANNDKDFGSSMDEFESDQKIDPRKVTTIVGFGGSAAMGGLGSAASSDSYTGTVIWSEFTSEELVSSLENNETVSLSESSYNDTTLYTDENSGQVYAALGGGVFVVGSQAAVEDVIDLADGSGSAVSGTLRSSYTDTREAPVRLAATLPETESSGSTSTPMSPGGTGGMGGSMAGGATQNVSHISGSFLYASGNERGLELSLVYESSDSAAEAKKGLDSLLDVYKDQPTPPGGTDSGSQLPTLLEHVSVSQDGATVSLSYEDTVDNIVSAIESSDSLMGSGMSSGASPMTPM